MNNNTKKIILPVFFSLIISIFIISSDSTVFAQTTAYPYSNLSNRARSLIVPIPQLNQWETNITTYGTALCQTLLNATNGADNATNYDTRYRGIYYDGERIYYQIADYTNNPTVWNSCADLAERFYRDRFLVNNGSAAQGWNIFPHGLYIDYLRTGDTVSRQYAIDLSYNAAFASAGTPLSWTADTQSSREVAYNIESFLVSEELGELRRARLADFVNQALGHIDQWFVSRTAIYVRPFMVGLTAEALIQYYEKTGDQRIPPAIQTAMDWLWQNTWLPQSGSFMYTDRDATNIDGSGDMGPAPVLNLLIAPAYSWLYKHTGDTKYRDQSDQIFAGGVNQASSFLSTTDGKFFNQNYRWSFDYIKWRVEGELGSATSTLPDTVPPSIPANLSSIAVSATQINLSWTVSTDNVGVTGYRIYRCSGANCAPTIQIATSTTNSYSNTGLTASTIYAYSVSAYDAAGNVSNQSSSASATTQSVADTTPPARTNGSPSGALSATTTQVILSLTTNENATCRYSTTANTGYASMTGSFTTTNGINHSTAISNLSGGQIYNYYVRCSDASNNQNINDYLISFSVAQAYGSAVISWNANTESDLAGYRIYYGTSPRNNSCPPANYSTSTRVGNVLTYTINNLLVGQTYYFSTTAYDTSNNESCFSNEGSKTITSSTSTPPDTTPPSAISNLSSSNISQTSATLNWTSPGDDGNSGTASSYDIRYSTFAITSSNWNSATQVSGEPVPLLSGSNQTFTVVGLQPNTLYYFAIRTTDDAGNVSSLSNIASVRTQSLTLSVSLSVNPNSGVSPLNNVSLTASVSGSSQGTINYTFYCNRSDSGVNITAPYSAKYDNQSATSSVASNLCSYQSSGSYSAKVIVERGTMISENRATIIVSAPTITPAPTPISTPSSGGGGGGGSGYSGGSYSDTIPPSTPSSFSALTSNKQISLIWKNPTDSDFVRVLISRKEGSQPASRTDGTYVYEGNAETFIDKKAENNKTYYYAIYSYDKKPNFSAPAIVSATPLSSITLVPASSSQISPSQNVVIVGPFALGQKSEQVKILQQTLSNDKEIYPEGIITGYYGNATKSAVVRFQQKYGLVSDGIAGPETRSKLNEVYAPLPASSQVNQALVETIQKQIQFLQQKLIELLAKLAEMLKNQIQ